MRVQKRYHICFYYGGLLHRRQMRCRVDRREFGGWDRRAYQVSEFERHYSILPASDQQYRNATAANGAIQQVITCS